MSNPNSSQIINDPNFIIGVVALPIDSSVIITNGVCPTGHLNEVIYACQTGSSVYGVCLDSGTQCNNNDWAIHVAERSCGPQISPYPQLYCSHAYNSGQASTEASPYNFMAGYSTYVTVPANLKLPTAGGHLPDYLGVNGGPAELDGTFAVLADQTPTTLPTGSNGNQVGQAYLVVAYATSWFSTITDINNFLQYGWANKGAPGSVTNVYNSGSYFTYKNSVIPNVDYQLYLYALMGYNTSSQLSVGGICAQTTMTNCLTPTGATNGCSNYMSNDPNNSANNLCHNIVNTLFGVNVQPTCANLGIPSPQDSPPGPCGNDVLFSAYAASTSKYCSTFNTNNAPPECFCVNPKLSALYNDITNAGQSSIVNDGFIGCWWGPCRNIQEYLPATPGFVFPNSNTGYTPPSGGNNNYSGVCAQQFCGTITNYINSNPNINKANINQLVSCNFNGNGGGGGGPTVPFDWGKWLTIGGIGIGVIIVIFVIIYFISNLNKDEKEEDKT